MLSGVPYWTLVSGVSFQTSLLIEFSRNDLQKVFYSGELLYLIHIRLVLPCQVSELLRYIFYSPFKVVQI